MEKYYLESALNAAREMIQSYFVERNVDKVLKHLSPMKFKFVGLQEGIEFDSAKQFARFAESALDLVPMYKVIEEKYTIGNESQDSCLIIAKLKLFDTRTQKTFVLNYFMYFNQQGNKIMCQHYHVSRPLKMNEEIRSVFFNDNIPYPRLANELISYKEDLLEFMNAGAVAEKSFYYEEKYPYRFVNHKYLKLLGYSKINSFISEQNYSSLVNIHAADQNRYVEYLQKHYAEKIGERNFEPQYKYRSTYYVSYRLQSPFLSEEVKVLEWGNFFTQSGRTTVNCFVVNLNDVERLSFLPPIHHLQQGNECDEENELGSEAISVRTDFSIHISKDVLIYPRMKQIKINNEMVELTPIECEIFLVLLDKLNQAVTVDEIYGSIWNDETLHLTSNVLPMHISNIRRKLKKYEEEIKLVYIKNEGYSLQV